MKKRIVTFIMTLIMALSMFTVSASASSISNFLNINWNHIASVGNQASSSSVACGCYAMAYARTILDGTPRSWSTYNYNSGGENNACAYWARGGYNINRPSSRSAVFTAAYNSINSGRPLIVYVTGRNSSGRNYQHYVALVGYTNVTNPNSLSESNFLFIDSVPGATKSTTENLGTCSRAYTLRTENGAYKYISTNSGGVSTTSSGSSVSTGSNTNSGSYFPRCSSSCTTITAGLQNIGVNSSYSYREQIAAANGISDYRGSAAQNNQMLAMLKSGTLRIPGSPASTQTNSVSYFPRCSSSCTTITAGLQNIGANSSYSYREQIASRNNISGYRGTAAQNNQMLAMLKAGTLIKP